MSALTAERVRDLLAYDPETGWLIWKVWRNQLACVGDRAGYLRGDGYRVINVSHRVLLAHRIVWLHVYGDWPVDMIDHVNGEPDDNRLCNLRQASRSQNMMNMAISPANTSGVKGVSFNKQSHSWEAYIGLNRRKIKLGCYPSLAQAAAVRRTAERELHGQFARQQPFGSRMAQPNPDGASD